MNEKRNDNKSSNNQKNKNSNKETTNKVEEEKKDPVISFICPVCSTFRAVRIFNNFDAFSCFNCKSIFTYTMISNLKYDINVIKKEVIIPTEIIEACEMLDIDIKNISLENIKQNYKKFQNKYHPDKVSHLGKEFQDFAEEKVKSINGAYELLKKWVNGQ